MGEYFNPVGAQSTKSESTMDMEQVGMVSLVDGVMGERRKARSLASWLCSKSKPWGVYTHSSHFPRIAFQILLPSLPPSPIPGHAYPGSAVSVCMLVSRHPWKVWGSNQIFFKEPLSIYIFESPKISVILIYQPHTFLVKKKKMLHRPAGTIHLPGHNMDLLSGPQNKPTGISFIIWVIWLSPREEWLG